MRIESRDVASIIFVSILLFSMFYAGSFIREGNRLQENTVYTLPDGNKIKIKQEGKNSVIMPANEVVKEK